MRIAGLVALFATAPACAVGGGDQGPPEPWHEAGLDPPVDDAAPPLDDTAAGPLDDDASGDDGLTVDGCRRRCDRCGASDGCGGTCAFGVCPGEGETCVRGKCIVCTPRCLMCGADDGCGRPCATGSCPKELETCVAGKCTCVSSCTMCGGPDGCGGTCTKGTCDGGGTCVGGVCLRATRSEISPGSYPGSWGAFAREVTWTLASEDPSTIRYTLDGSEPTAASASGASPRTLSPLADGVTMKWFADNGVREPTAHAWTARVSTTLRTYYGYIVEGAKISGSSPVVVAAPGSSLAGSAKYQAWVSGRCPRCRLQIVYGVGTSSAGCLYDWSPGTWPGASGTASMRLTAPSAAGTYKVRVAFSLELSCADAIARGPLGVRPTTEVGTIVVR